MATDVVAIPGKEMIGFTGPLYALESTSAPCIKQGLRAGQATSTTTLSSVSSDVFVQVKETDAAKSNISLHNQERAKAHAENSKPDASVLWLVFTVLCFVHQIHIIVCLLLRIHGRSQNGTRQRPVLYCGNLALTWILCQAVTPR